MGVDWHARSCAEFKTFSQTDHTHGWSFEAPIIPFLSYSQRICHIGSSPHLLSSGCPNSHTALEQIQNDLGSTQQHLNQLKTEFLNRWANLQFRSRWSSIYRFLICQSQRTHIHNNHFPSPKIVHSEDSTSQSKPPESHHSSSDLYFPNVGQYSSSSCPHW